MLKNGKAQGEDVVIAKLLEDVWKDLMIQLKQLVDIIWRQEQIPTR